MIPRYDLPPRYARKLDLDAGDAKDRRALLRSLNRCINGPTEDRPGKRGGVVHGPVVKGGRCQRCWDVKVKSERRSA